ncbi:MAG TPA: D-alanine--D-alanine ligase [Myxococcales bacterium LLY-WYZ-16_1]|jgi:D-alanine-D-alanine ligase|nr:D-alanine--D-alanine ligase [Myxococcales bacterium LLY-WYZ-16_1]
MTRVAVLMGGPSHEHDISLASGGQVLEALGARGFEVRIGRDGTWAVDGDVQPSLGRALDAVADRTDVAFLALHGPFGEDGTVQALLEAAGVAYTGSGPAASALAMDKLRAKHVYRSTGLPTAPFAAWSRRDGGETPDLAAVPGPWVVKPSCEGSSFGVVLADTEGEVRSALQRLAAEGRTEALIETRIAGREFTCAVLDEPGNGPRALPVTELIPGDGHRFFDTEAKYRPGATAEVTPAPIPDGTRDRLQTLALQAHRALGCRDVSRTDFMVEDAEGADPRPWLLETNTIPGLTTNSLLPQAAEAAGLPFPRLVERLVRLAEARRSISV